MDWRVLLKRAMGSDLILIAGVGARHAAQERRDHGGALELPVPVGNSIRLARRSESGDQVRLLELVKSAQMDAPGPVPVEELA
jgi:hypothetical protein